MRSPRHEMRTILDLVWSPLATRGNARRYAAKNPGNWPGVFHLRHSKLNRLAIQALSSRTVVPSIRSVRCLNVRESRMCRGHIRTLPRALPQLLRSTLRSTYCPSHVGNYKRDVHISQFSRCPCNTPFFGSIQNRQISL